MTNQLARRHLAAPIVIAQEGGGPAVVRMMRAETCRLVSAICTCLNLHELDSAGRCPVCDSTSCALLAQVRRALLPVQLSTRDRQ
ncbi:MAG TPA: hypothetical protein VGX25_28650 [Actinophytocola sp.]|uniref:hypothetical protein n=1 Tax=Actinophytocola sp. TaxID=1872138 RepID=UPI002DDCB6CD|nr:hypothetical protein [Actinophytocola sp.]HEV2783372.1 hypothetical protein [Actinophytocola sp.]